MVMNERIVYKLIRYILQALIIYLILRYMPCVKLDQFKSVIITFVLIMLCGIIEYVYTTFGDRYNENTNVYKSELGQKDLFEKFDTCDTCATPDTAISKLPPGGKCRIVCDDVKDGARNEAKDEISAKIKTMPRKYYDDPGFGGMFYDEYQLYDKLRNANNDRMNDIDTYDKKKGLEEQNNLEQMKKIMEKQSTSTAGYDKKYQETGSKSERNIPPVLHKGIIEDIDNELSYSDYNHLPVASGYKSHEYEYGYSFLPPEKWYNQPVTPPICITNNRSPVMPIYAQGTPIDVKEFNSSRRVMPPDQISVKYINDKLNAGI